ncbi:MAG: LytR C-terminal domain-containing protein [Actinomycetaceae bacterium]|nr:LytR C-terminal domain-containing protein [Actinomycetaceae bacterium]MDO5747023.1 LytR C-terminal domain-containing protein [Actinomycetaceae bacterium]
MSVEQYEKDEFDKAAPHHPVGVHRRPVPRWKELAPFIAVLIIFPLLAWAVSMLIAQEPGSDKPQKTAEPVVSQPATTESASEEPKEPEKTETTPQEDVSPLASQEPTQDTPHGAANKALSVMILNVNAPQGSAAKAQQALTTEGYTSTSIGNSAGMGINQTSVYYDSEASKDTALALAATLKIDTVQESSQLAAQSNTNIVVFLKGGYTAP